MLKVVDSGLWLVTCEEKLKTYANLLTEWNKKINLVSPNSIADLWERHIEDSKQLAEYLDINTPIIDVGSGAGLPGLILAIMGYEVTLIESDQRKCVFLQEAARVCGVLPAVVNKRVEEVRGLKNESIITARAFAPLAELFGLTKHLGGSYVLLKGANIEAEIAEAQRVGWRFDYTLHKSRYGSGFILEMSDVAMRDDAKVSSLSSNQRSSVSSKKKEKL